jgi:hypothetical protein
MKTLTIGRGRFNGVAYSPDGQTLVSVNARWRLRFWDLATYTERLALTLPQQEAGFYFQPLCLAGGLLALNGGLWDISPAWEHLGGLRGQTAGAPRSDRPLCAPVALEGAQATRLVTLAPGGRAVAGALWDSWPRREHQVRLWDTGGRCRRQCSVADIILSGLALAPDGQTLALTTLHRVVLLFDLASGREVARLQHTDVPTRLLFSPDGRLLATLAGKSAWLWDVATHRPLTRFRAFQRYAEALAFHPAGRLLGVGGRDGEVRLLDTSDLRQVACLDWGVGAVHDLAFAPDGMTVAAAGQNNALVVWDLEEI